MVGGGNGAPATNRIQQVDGAHSYGYDAAGNLTTGEGWTRTYDAANRITSANAVQMEYDGDGRRVKNDEAGAGNVTLYYLWSSVLGEVAADLRPDFAEVYHIPFRAYVYSPAGGTPLAMQGYNTGFYFLYPDHLGSGHKVADEAGGVVQRYEGDPHGQSVLETGSFGSWFNQKKFTGYERDYAGGTYYAKARQYQPYRGRFMQADPLGLASSDLSAPQSLNLYSYVHNDPVNRVDPDGLDDFPYGGHEVFYTRERLSSAGTIVGDLIPAWNVTIGDPVAGGGTGVLTSQATAHTENKTPCQWMAEIAQYEADRAISLNTEFSRNPRWSLNEFDRTFSQLYIGRSIGPSLWSAISFGWNPGRVLSTAGIGLVGNYNPVLRGEAGFKDVYRDTDPKSDLAGRDVTHHVAVYLSAGIQKQALAAYVHSNGDNSGDQRAGKVGWDIGTRLRHNPYELRNIGRILLEILCN